MPVAGATRLLLRVGSAITLAFLYMPLVVIGIYAFNETRVQRWPPSGLTLEWFDKAFANQGVRDALWASVKVGIGATAIALVLGTLAAYALARHDFFGKNTISFLVVLPIALPGIVTGMALNATFTQVLEIDLTLMTIIVAHATFCIVLVFNNVVARLRRTSASLEEAAADLGAGGLRAFRDITFPQMRSALIAGALLAFALSFDEVIVTTFTAGDEQTLPIWILNNLSRPRNLPIVNVVALVVILLSLIPVWIAQRLSTDPVTAVGTVKDVPAEPVP
jgi:putative spermidine/putrescine transport system permease protein